MTAGTGGCLSSPTNGEVAVQSDSEGLLSLKSFSNSFEREMHGRSIVSKRSLAKTCFMCPGKENFVSFQEIPYTRFSPTSLSLNLKFFFFVLQLQKERKKIE
jgi:hypothetical protein